MKDTIKLKGRVYLKIVENATGRIIEERHIDNLVVNTGKGKVCLCLSVASGSNIVTQIGAGTSSTTPTLADTALTGAATIPLGAITYPTGESVQWAFDFDTAHANGITVQELGLLAADGTLFSRITIAPIAKTSAISIIGTWNISL
jgi:hypothetical protein